MFALSDFFISTGIMKTWTEHEMNVIKTYAPDGMDAVCARLPSKSRISIFSKASKIGVSISKPKLPYDPNGGELANKTWIWFNRILPELIAKGECLEWHGAHSKGYGQIRFFVSGAKRIFSTHRIAVEVKQQSLIPEGLSSLHRCDNPKCNNPDHLFVGDDLANVTDMHSKNRAKGMFEKGRVPHGNIARGERSGASVLTNVAVMEARVIYDAGLLGYKLLARRAGVSGPAMSRVVRMVGWKHIPPATEEQRNEILRQFLSTNPAKPKRTGKSLSPAVPEALK